MMADLIAFLTDRWDEEQRIAEAADFQVANIVGQPSDCTDWQLLAEDFERRMISWSEAVADHVELHSPARVLADIAAKRVLLSFLDPREAPSGEGRFVAERALLLLVQPHRDHPDFDPTWSVPT